MKMAAALIQFMVRNGSGCRRVRGRALDMTVAVDIADQNTNYPTSWHGFRRVRGGRSVSTGRDECKSHLALLQFGDKRSGAAFRFLLHFSKFFAIGRPRQFAFLGR